MNITICKETRNFIDEGFDLEIINDNGLPEGYEPQSLVTINYKSSGSKEKIINDLEEIINLLEKN